VLKKECLKVNVEVAMVAVVYNVLGGLENALNRYLNIKKFPHSCMRQVALPSNVDFNFIGFEFVAEKE